MDKSFNDQELSDIMKEIEALEQDFIPSTEVAAEPTAATETDAPSSETVLSTDFVGGTQESEEFTEVSVTSLQTDQKPEHFDPVSNVVPLDHRPTAANPKEHRPAASTSMSFKVSGDLTLELAFDIGGQTVALEVTESGLSIEMEGGMKFTVPMKQKSELKKAV